MPLFAGFLTGGYIRYDFVGIFSGYYKYDVEVILYRNCNPGFGAFNNTIPVGIFTGDTLLATQNLNFTGYQEVTPLPSNMCVQVGRYFATLVLAPHSTGYTLAFQRCCHDALTKNIYDPNWSGFTLTATIPSTPNSAPLFVNKFPSYMMLNQDFSYNLSATDNDSDEIVYEIGYPLAGGSITNPNPNPPEAPPYTTLPYAPPYSFNDILGGTPALTYGASSGIITAKPNQPGIFVIALKVTEKRGGQPMASYQIEMTIQVSTTFPVSIPEKENLVYTLHLNRSEDYLSIVGGLGGKITSEMIDLNGKTTGIYEGNEIPVQYLQSGFYIIRVMEGNYQSFLKWHKK